MSLSVCHLISTLDRYGAAQPVRAVAASTAREDWPTEVLAYSETTAVREELSAHGVGGHELKRRGPLDFIALGRLNRYLASQRPAIVHAWDAVALQNAKLTLPSGAESQLVASLNAADLASEGNRRLVRALREKIAAVVVPDETSKQACLALGYAADELELVRPGVATATASGTRAELLAELGLPEAAQLIVSAGRLTREKQLDEAIWAFELVRVLHPESRLLIAGDGPDRERLERFARQVSEPECVLCLGERDDVASILPHADVFWQPSASPAPPIALLEAMAASVAVVANTTSVHQEYVASEETGLLAAATDRAAFAKATCRLLEEPELRRSLGEAAREQVAKEYRLDAEVEAYRNVYEALAI